MKKLVALAVLFVLGACGWHGSGTVIQKDYDAAWVQSTVSCHQTNGKGGVICVPETRYWPEEYRLRIRSDADGSAHWVSVSESEYSTASIGGSFSNEEVK